MERKNIFVFLILIILSILMLIFPNRVNTEFVRNYLTYPIKPFFRFTSFLRDNSMIRSEYEIILKRYEDDFIKHRISEDIVEENKILREMLMIKKRMDYDIVVAEIIGIDGENFSYMLIDKGSKNSISEGLPVVFVNGIIGRVSETTENTSRIDTYNNINFRVSASDKKGNIIGIAQNIRRDILIVKNVEKKFDLKLKDTIFTSGAGGLFPYGISIGEIMEIRDIHEYSVDLIIKPFEKIVNKRFALILKEIENSEKPYNKKDVKRIGKIGWYEIMEAR